MYTYTDIYVYKHACGVTHYVDRNVVRTVVVVVAVVGTVVVVVVVVVVSRPDVHGRRCGPGVKGVVGGSQRRRPSLTVFVLICSMISSPLA